MGITNKIALVQCYIHHKNNIEVKIAPPKSLREIMLLEKAYAVAVEYFENNRV